ncbi:superoxide dismutase, putative [Perkinsus marinus ATCC 50983]|uniref:Superoxide dismutase [Fe] n=2 Tax=Perkinsus marinus TaxID=31276 RepID=C5LD82_PERM5|nr:superoxide dismutase, putative [Perkinsus marinus ATCC 50983]2CW3_A Chain A, iron superoxide dismutase [Perkinsus marinus]2CW3_B Chain B, iron superoxide dismutase [Perkinsus marinus]AAM22284.1 superoxide dismutase 2 [Perkinsus marinus]AAN38991.1 iron superoxide dismutase [Perkinsus marinus]EER05214.1 superoxide dismutase, putative [Perkinsus marinus ATCC 50983]|eukprot:XP_002773398.1 superoxide dismutase, putative [Perkinsus marinus ATCC 50983]
MRLSGSDGRRLTYRTSPRVRASLLLLGAIVLLVYFAETLFVVCRGSMDSRAVRHAIPSGKGLRAKPFVPSRSGVAPSSGLRMTLPYGLEALEPVISAATVDFHYNKHHQGYIQKLLDATGLPESRINLKSLVTLGPDRAGENVFNAAGQIYNHNMYWLSMVPTSGSGRHVPPRLLKLIRARWGNVDEMKENFMRKATALFGSGWIWLVWDTRERRLDLVGTKDAHSPLSEDAGKIPLFTCDVWEHAYYLDYQHDRAAYLTRWWSLINWEFADSNLPSDIE